jgi:trk system potassium uptake protein
LLGERVPKSRVINDERVIIIGLGRFGRGVAKTLHELGYEVTAIDLDERQVESAADFVSLAVQGDGADEELLRSLQADRAGVGIVAQGRSLESNVLAALILKKIGVRWVVAKATNDLHGELLRRIGVNRVVYPERDAAVRLAHAIAVPSINDYISLSPTSGVAKFEAPHYFVGQTMAELYGDGGAQLSVLLIKRGNMMVSSPSFQEPIQAGDEIVVAGPDRDIERFVEGPNADRDREQ